MKSFSIILLSLFVFTLTTAELECPGNFSHIADKCYLFHQNRINWQNAERTCAEEGAKLASVITIEEYSELLEYINIHYAGTYWISGAPVNGEWIWTGTQAKMNPDWFGRTPSTEPSKCAYFCSYTHKYWDGNCVDHKRFICEKDISLQGEGEVEIDNFVHLLGIPEI